jgi:hypothetical protein
MAEIAQSLKLFSDFKVDCVIVGGVAAGARGSSQVTYDVDVCYSRTPENLRRLADALRSVGASLRGAPKDLPFLLDDETLRRGLNFTFDTSVGNIDVLGEVSGVGDYAECLKDSSQAELFGIACQIISLEKLIAAKRTAGRSKDLAALPELEAILEQERRSKTDDSSEVNDQEN